MKPTTAPIATTTATIDMTVMADRWLGPARRSPLCGGAYGEVIASGEYFCAPHGDM